MEERDLVTVGLWLPLVMGCGETMPPSPEEHSRGHLSRVERGRAAGCRRTLPPPPLSPKTAAESSVSGHVSMLAFRARSSQLPCFVISVSVYVLEVPALVFCTCIRVFAI
ncbi:uncharacterized protein LOC110267556 isoform X2 [Arachis ipaensis]|uniref:uncharacterized protein LOC110267556 isoform X2 n=1 Tax=Arachis ipaensis TaxID=130454 RepID=UPI000A2B1CBF|nr:uncharacterized protein LOC110267556 isoform X2 [Arachis ipaensis]